MRFRQAVWDEPSVFEYSRTSRTGFAPLDDDDLKLVERARSVLGELFRESLNMPTMSELEVVRHFTRLTQMSYGVETGPVPLGSCTMKYNPRLGWRLVNDPSFVNLHPTAVAEGFAQGLLDLAYYVKEVMRVLTGMDECSLQPPAGASGELAGVLMTKAYHKDMGLVSKDEMLVADSAHGTNPASSAMAGYKVIRVPTDENGLVDLEALRSVLNERTAGLMLTNPNTLGLFEERIREIADAVHEVSGVLYYDGANLNGILGISRPGDMGFDIVHINVHKTFAAPHGSGGPGSGVVCAKGRLVDYLPGYVVVRNNDGTHSLVRPRKSIGDMATYYGNFPAIVYAYAFVMGLGEEGLREVARQAVLNTNLLTSLLKDVKGISLPYAPQKPRLHEAVFSARELARDVGVGAGDVAKFLLDEGLHAPTIYFPLIVEEALMIEMTESETVETVERYAEAIKEAEKRARENPAELKALPVNTSVKKLDAVRANHPKTVTPSYKVERERAREQRG